MKVTRCSPGLNLSPIILYPLEVALLKMNLNEFFLRGVGVDLKLV